MSDTDHLVARIAQAARKVFDDSPVFLAYVHGSRIHGRPSLDSDLDIGYYAEGYPHAEPLLLGELDLEGQLSEELDLRVDLRDLASAPLEFRGGVLEDGRRIYCRDDDARIDLEVDLLSRWHDCKEDYRRMHEIQLQRFAERGLRHG